MYIRDLKSGLMSLWQLLGEYRKAKFCKKEKEKLSVLHM
jgi:hypothetical protein